MWSDGTYLSPVERVGEAIIVQKSKAIDPAKATHLIIPPHIEHS